MDTPGPWKREYSAETNKLDWVGHETECKCENLLNIGHEKECKHARRA